MDGWKIKLEVDILFLSSPMSTYEMEGGSRDGRSRVRGGVGSGEMESFTFSSCLKVGNSVIKLAEEKLWLLSDNGLVFFHTAFQGNM